MPILELKIKKLFFEKKKPDKLYIKCVTDDMNVFFLKINLVCKKSFLFLILLK